MASGLPVVATAVSGIPELLRHDVNGLLVQPNSAAEVAAAIEALHHHPPTAERLSRNARQHVQQGFDGDTSVQVLSALLISGVA